MRLLTGKPGWRTSADVIVIGSGVAGLTTALNLRSYGLSVLLVTKAKIDEGSTRWAQGGIAAALGPGDTPDQHKKDTLIAGAGLCDTAAVNVLGSLPGPDDGELAEVLIVGSVRTTLEANVPPTEIILPP